MVERISYICYNFYGPRLLEPARAPPGLKTWKGYPISRLIGALPFHQTNLRRITRTSDFIQFGEIFDYREDSDLLQEFAEFIDEFNAESEPPLSGAKDYDLKDDREFVTAAKYPFALRQMLRVLIGEDYAFCIDLPYLAEAENDLLVSFELAVRGQSKHSIQMLRSVLEVAVAHAYFGMRGENYGYLAANPDFRMPPFGGSKGMMRLLVGANVIPESLAQQGLDLYSHTSKAIHSHISHLGAPISKRGLPTDWLIVAPRVGAMLLELVLRLLMKGI